MLADLLIKMREEDKLDYLLEARRYILAIRYICNSTLSDDEKARLIEAKNLVTDVINNLLRKETE